MMSGRRRRVDEIPQDQAVIVGTNIRVLRQQHGWNQAKVGDLMGWPSNSTVCAAEGRRNGRQRGFTADEVERLAAIFGISSSQLTTLCADCGGYPPTGFACLTCGARSQYMMLNSPAGFRKKGLYQGEASAESDLYVAEHCSAQGE